MGFDDPGAAEGREKGISEVSHSTRQGRCGMQLLPALMMRKSFGRGISLTSAAAYSSLQQLSPPRHLTLNPKP